MYKYNLYGDITAETATDFSAFLKSCNGDDVIINIDSPGGCLASALKMYRNCEQYNGKIIAQIESIAASAAGFIAVSCDELRVNETSLLMLHAPWCTAEGDSDELMQVAEILDTWAKVIKDIIKDKANMTDEEVDAIFSKESWFTASDCVEKFGAVNVGVAGMLFNRAHCVNIKNYCKDIPAELAKKMEVKPVDYSQIDELIKVLFDSKILTERKDD